MGITPEEKLFAKFKNYRFLLTLFNLGDSNHLKKFLFGKGLSKVTYVENAEKTLEKLSLGAFHFIFFHLDAADGKFLLDQLVDSHHFDNTAFFGFSRSVDAYKGIYSSSNINIHFSELPFKMGELEKGLVSVMLKGKIEPNLVGEQVGYMKHYNLGCNALGRQKLEEAKNELILCLKAEGTFVDAYIKLAEVMIALKKFDVAINVLIKARSLDHDNYKIIFLYGVIEALLEHKKNALTVFEQVMKTQGENAHVAADIGCAMMKQNWVDEALIFFDTAKNISPEYLYVYNMLGISLSKAGNYDDAEKAYQKALEIDESDAGINFNMGTLWKRKNNIEKARKYFKASLELDPDLDEAKEMLKKLSSG